MPARYGMEQIEYAIAQRDDERLFMRWTSLAQYEMSFDDFKKKLQKPVLRDDDEILDEVGEILTKFERVR